jgi:hypothetical protein
VPRDHHLVAGGRIGEGRRLRRDYDGQVQRVYLGSARALSVLLILLGLALIASAVARGGGVLALGVVVGACLTLAGGGRLWLMRGVRGEPR